MTDTFCAGKALERSKSQIESKLPCLRDIEYQTGTRPSWAASMRGALKRLFQCLALLVILAILLAIKSRKGTSNIVHDVGSQVPSQVFAPHEWMSTSAPWPSCPSTVASRNFTMGFNPIADESKWFFSEYNDPEAPKKLKGGILFVLGSPSQPSEMEVNIQVRSTNVDDLMNVVPVVTGQNALNIAYKYRNVTGLCTEVQTIVSLRPSRGYALGNLDIATSLFDAGITGDVDWKFNRLAMRSTLGRIMAMLGGENWLKVATLPNSPIDGHAHGFSLMGEHLTITTAEADVYAYLEPQMDYPLKTLSISSTTGDIKANVPYGRDWPSKYAPQETNISSTLGDIWANLRHVSKTNIISTNGSIDATIVPSCLEGARRTERGRIYTSSERGNVSVRIANPGFGDDLWDLSSFEGNPLNSTDSEHHVGEGHLFLRYPNQWWGEVAGKVGQGILNFTATDLDNVYQQERFVLAKRGRDGGSQLSAHVGKGELHIEIGMDE